MLLCSISIDRVISVMFLHRAKLLCTPRVAAWVTCALVVFNFLLSSHFLVFESGYTKPKETHQTESPSTHIVSQQQQHHNLSKSLNHAVAESLISDGNIPDTTTTDTSRNSAAVEYVVVCDPVPDTVYAIVVHDAWKIIDMIIYAFIPFTIMLICSVIIIGRVAQQSKKFKKNKKKPSTTTTVLKNNRAMSKDRAMSNLSDDLILTTNNVTPPAATQKSTGDTKSNEAARMSARTRNLALMLIPVNFLFLAFLAPVVIAMYTYDQLWDDKLTLAIIELLSYCNFTINFFIYFLTSSKFREEFFKFIDEVCRRKGGSGGGYTSGNNNASTATKKTTIRNGDNNKSSGIRRPGPPERV